MQLDAAGAAEAGYHELPRGGNAKVDGGWMAAFGLVIRIILVYYGIL
jgi:hypothetical protein